MDTNKYFAFISYKREDEEWAIWFQHEMEHYHLPVTLNGRSDLPSEFRPVFRDIDELKAGNLPEQIYDALASSSYLIVVCSPNSAKSKWVNKEITDFIEIGKTKGIDNIRNIFPFIVDGTPHSQNDEDECFPKALRDLQDKEERIGGNVNENGRDKAFVKVLAGMLPNVAFDELWNRYEKDKAEEQRIERERRDNLLQLQSRFVAEKVMSIANENSFLASLLAMDVLPKDLENPDRPYTVEAERALRKSFFFRNLDINVKDSRVLSVVFSIDGKRIISACEDNNLHIWDSETGEELQVVRGHFDCISSAVFSSDRTQVISTTDFRHNNDVFIWNAETGEVIRRLHGHNQKVRLAVFSPDGKRVVSADDDTLRIWNAETGEELTRIDDEILFVHTVHFSSDGLRFVTASAGKTIRIWDVKTGTMLKVLQGQHGFQSAVFSSDGLHVVSVSFDSVVNIWDIESGRMLMELDRHNKMDYAIYSPDGHKIIAVSPKKITVWNAKTGEEQDTIKCYGTSCPPVFSPEGKRVVFACHSGTIHIRTMDTGCTLQFSLEHVTRVSALSPNKRHLVTAHEKTISIWDLMVGKRIKVFKGHEAEVESVNYSADGYRIVSASSDKTIRVWDTQTGEGLIIINEHGASAKSAVFSPDGTRVISASDDGTIRAWDAETGQEIIVLYSSDRDYCNRLSFTFCPDGSRIVTIDNGHLYLLNSTTGEKIVDRHGCNSAIFSPEGPYMIILSDRNTIEIVNIDYWIKQVELSFYNQPWHMECPTEKVFKGYEADFSPDGRLAIIGSDDSIIIWDVEKKVVLKELKKAILRRYNESSVFSPDGEQFFFLGSGGIHICNTTIWEDIAVLPVPHGSIIADLSFSNDGRKLMVTIANGSIFIWEVPPLQELIDQTRERFKDRPLTPEEREQYYLE